MSDYKASSFAHVLREKIHSVYALFRRAHITQCRRMRGIRVALMIETYREYGRSLLRGISHYQQNSTPWSVYFTHHQLNSPPSKEFLNWQGDGILLRTDNPQMVEAALSKNIPIIDLRASLPDLNIPIVGIDNTLIAKCGFEHFYERGFTNYAFYGTPVKEHYYQDMRGKKFAHFVNQKNFKCSFYTNPDLLPWDEQQTHLADWIKKLPKPVAIMACHDEKGLQLLDACLRADISVPNDVAILGVDDDPYFNKLCAPPLSSISVNADLVGYEAATQLERLISNKKMASNFITTPPRGVTVRQSTDIMAVKDPHVVQAIELIREYAYQGEPVDTLLKRIPLSRTSLYRRFKKHIGCSPKEEMTRLRMDYAKKLLCNTSIPTSEIALRTGYSEPAYFTTTFKRKFKTTPLQYRKKFTTLEFSKT